MAAILRVRDKDGNVIDVPAITGGKGENVQSNWEQNDSESPEYVKGRTHWTEKTKIEISKSFNEISSDNVLSSKIANDIYSKLGYDNVNFSESVGVMLCNVDSTASFIPSDEDLYYQIPENVIDGTVRSEPTQFTLKTVSYGDNKVYVYDVGAAPVRYTSDVGAVVIPETFEFDGEEYPKGIYFTEIRYSDYQMASAKLIHSEESVHKLDKKYLPDDISTGDASTIVKLTDDSTASEIYEKVEAIYLRGESPSLMDSASYMLYSCLLAEPKSEFFAFGITLVRAVNNEPYIHVDVIYLTPTAIDTAVMDVPIIPMQGAGEDQDGRQGEVPKPSAGDQNKFLRGDGTWSDALPASGEYGQVLQKNEYCNEGAEWVNFPLELFNAEGKTFDQVIGAYENGKICYVQYAGTKLLNNGYSGSQNPFMFFGVNANNEILTATLSTNNEWTFGERGNFNVATLEQSLTDEQKAQARTNIGAGTSDFSGSYNDLTDKPDISSGYTLPVASSSTLGGVKIGDGISVGDDGTISASGGSDDTTPFRLIRTISVTSDDGVSNVEISTDSDGNTFELNEAYAIVTSKSNYGAYAYAALSVNGHVVGEDRGGGVHLAHFFKFLGRWVASYTNYDYSAGGFGNIWGLGHKNYMLNILPDNPKITSLTFNYVACEMEVWGR